MAEPTRFLLTLSSVSAPTVVFKTCYPGKRKERDKRMKIILHISSHLFGGTATSKTSK